MGCKESGDFLQEVTMISTPVYVVIKMLYLFFQAEKDNKWGKLVRVNQQKNARQTA